MADALAAIRETVRPLRLDSSLLALNHILSVTRGLSKDANFEPWIGTLAFRPPAFLIHFLAKQLILHASNCGHRELDRTTFTRLVDLWLSIEDPIQHDPSWKHRDPTGFFERKLSQQIFRLNQLQAYGLALGLFRDVGTVNVPNPYDLRADIEADLGITIDEFMGFGRVCLGLRQIIGTFTPMDFAEAFAQKIDVCVPEVWSKFLPKVACDRDAFRLMCEREEYKATNPLFVQFEFNPLHRFPVIDVGSNRFIAVDPLLIVERTTFGLFYDLFERDRTNFATRFGHVFDKFIGDLRRLRRSIAITAVGFQVDR